MMNQDRIRPRYVCWMHDHDHEDFADSLYVTDSRSSALFDGRDAAVEYATYVFHNNDGWEWMPQEKIFWIATWPEDLSMQPRWYCLELEYEPCFTAIAEDKPSKIVVPQAAFNTTTKS